MKLHEAIESLLLEENEEMWIRPVSWVGGTEFFCLDFHTKSQLQIVPNSCGGKSYMVCDVELLIGEWELVHPDDVMEVIE